MGFPSVKTQRSNIECIKKMLFKGLSQWLLIHMATSRRNFLFGNIKAAFTFLSSVTSHLVMTHLVIFIGSMRVTILSWPISSTNYSSVDLIRT